MVRCPPIDLSGCCYSAGCYKPVVLSQSLRTHAERVLSPTATLAREEAPRDTARLFSKCSHPDLVLFTLKPGDEARIDFNPHRLWYAFESFVWLR